MNRVFLIRAAWILVICSATAQAYSQSNGGFTLSSSNGKTAPASARTLVIYNSKEPDSEKLARFYAEQRAIPAAHVVGLECALTEEISREEYDRTIAKPLRALFEKHGWWHLGVAGHEATSPLGPVQSSEINFVALMRGMPLRVAQTTNYEGDQPAGPPPVNTRNEASVDSEIAALGFYSQAITGTINNPYYRSFLPIEDAMLPGLLLVCRLDAPTPDMVRRMIRDSLQAEKSGLQGIAYVDGRGIKEGGLAEGDRWLANLAKAARRAGSPVVFDGAEAMLPAAYPMRSASLYFGWYTQDVAGPMAQEGFRFVPGAVAVHIHSFSAVSLRDARRGWAAPLIAAGAAATLGNVAEPYLALTPNLDIFHDRLRTGLTFAESAWISQRAVSWMTTCIGDPLYRPFRADNDFIDQAPENAWRAYAKGAKVWAQNPERGTDMLQKAAAQYKDGMILEGLGLMQAAGGKSEAALESFEGARKLYSQPADVMRVTLHSVALLEQANPKGAAALAREQLKKYPREPASELLRELLKRLEPQER